MKSSKSKKNSDLLHLGFYGGLQKATVVLFGMFSTMILAHKAIATSDMGVWSLFLIIASFVEIIRHGLVKNSVIKYLSSGEEHEKEIIFSSAFFLNFIITALLGIILVCCAPLIVEYLKAPQLEEMIYWYVFALISLIPFSQFEWLMLAQLQFKSLFWIYVMRQGIVLLLQLGCVLLDVKVTLNMLVIFFGTGIFLGAICGFHFSKSYINLRFLFSTHWIKRLWHFGKYVFGTGVGNLVFRSTDSFMVSNILASTAIVAQQGISLRIFNLIDIPSLLIGDILFPKSASVANDNIEKIKNNYERSVGAVLSVILPAILFIIFFPKIPILILAGPDYLGAIPYLRLIMIVSIFLAFMKQFGTILDATGKPQLNFLIMTIIAILNLLSCYFFISKWGFIGAAYGLLFTHILSFIITQTILYRLYNIQFLNSFRYAILFYPEIIKMIRTRLFKKTIIQ